jgi:Leucine-rich repeat (LRR) protein
MSSFTSLHSIPPGKLEKLKADIKDGKLPVNVDLSNLGLSEIPPEIRELKDTVELLNLGGNNISELPEWIEEFKKVVPLRILAE